MRVAVMINLMGPFVVSTAIFNNATQLQELNDRFNELVPLSLFLENVEEKRKVSIVESIRRAYFPPGKITRNDVSGGINVSSLQFILVTLALEDLFL